MLTIFFEVLAISTVRRESASLRCSSLIKSLGSAVAMPFLSRIYGAWEIVVCSLGIKRPEDCVRVTTIWPFPAEVVSRAFASANSCCICWSDSSSSSSGEMGGFITTADAICPKVGKVFPYSYLLVSEGLLPSIAALKTISRRSCAGNLREGFFRNSISSRISTG